MLDENLDNYDYDMNDDIDVILYLFIYLLMLQVLSIGKKKICSLKFKTIKTKIYTVNNEKFNISGVVDYHIKRSK